MIHIQLSTTADWVSAGIRFFTNSRYSHADFVHPDGLLGAHVGYPEAGVCVRSPDYQDFARILILAVDAPDDVLRWAETQIGKPYDWLAMFNYGFQRRDWQRPDAWYCSELVAAAFHATGHDLFNPDFEAYRITPRDLQLSPLVKRTYIWSAPGWGATGTK